MHSRKHTKVRPAALIGLLSVVLVLGWGCSDYNPPTGTDEPVSRHGDLWNPGPGYMINGHEVPLVKEGYWENLYGPQVNPVLFRVSAAIGPEGGELVLGWHRLVVPRGAVDRVITFTLSYGSLTGLAMDCDPSPFSFAVPLRLRMSLRGTQYDNVKGEELPNLQIMYMAPDGSLEPVPSELDRGGRTVTGRISHFSRYIVG